MAHRLRSMRAAGADGAGGRQSWRERGVTARLHVDAAPRSPRARGPRPPWWTPAPRSTSVSCPTVKFCMAVDGTGNAVIHKRNNTWETPNPIDVGDGGFASVSCATTVFCMAVDAAGNELHYAYGIWFQALEHRPRGGSRLGVVPDGEVLHRRRRRRGTRRPTTATDVDRLPPPSTPATRLAAVSCPTESFCAAVDDSAAALAFNGTGWSSPTSIDAGQHRRRRCRVSRASLCAAVDDHRERPHLQRHQLVEPDERRPRARARLGVVCATAPVRGRRRQRRTR